MKKTLLALASLALVLSGLLATSCAPKPEIRVMSFNIRLSPREDFDGENCWNNRREAVIRMLEDA